MFGLYILAQCLLQLYLCAHLFGMLVHSIHECAHVLRVHVGVKAVAQVGDVALLAKTLQHLLHNVGNPLLKEGQSSGEVFSSSGFILAAIFGSFSGFYRLYSTRAGTLTDPRGGEIQQFNCLYVLTR